jgi:hypothetical protein
MISAALLGALGLTMSLVAFVFWQARRAAAAADSELAAVKKAAELELQLAARGRALDDRDRVIENLKEDVRRLENATKLLIQRDEAPIKDTSDAVDAMRDALGPLSPPGKLPVP